MAPIDIAELIRTITFCGLLVAASIIAWKNRNGIAKFWNPLTSVKGYGFELTKTSIESSSTPDLKALGISHHSAQDTYNPQIQTLWNENLISGKSSDLTFEQFLEVPDEMKEIVLAPLNRDIEDFALSQAGFDPSSFAGPVNLELDRTESIFTNSWVPYKRHLKKDTRTIFFTYVRLDPQGVSDQVQVLASLLMVAAPAFMAKPEDSWQVVLGVLDPTDGEAYTRFRRLISDAALPAIESGRLLLVPISIREEKLKDLIVISFNTVVEHLARELEKRPDIKKQLQEHQQSEVDKQTSL